jgi:hypothetical protein
VTFSSTRRSSSPRAFPGRRPRAALLLGALAAAAAAGACKSDSATSPRTSASVTGSISLSVSGLPSGATGDVVVQGPASYSRAVTGTTTLSDLVAGTYTITARDVSAGSDVYSPSPASQTAVVGTSGATVSVGVNYASTSGALSITVGGLPAGVNAAVTVAGPNSYSQALTGSSTLRGLKAGTYTLDAATVTAGGTVYAPTIDPPQLSVTAGATATGTVTYAPQQQAGADFSVAGMYIVQSVQKLDRSVPLVAGKDGVLRVFVRADHAVTATPSVLVKLFVNGTLRQTLTVAAPTTSVPTSAADVSEGSVASSWNVLVPGSLIVPGLSVSARVDPYNAYGETDETDNAYPASGTTAIAVQTPPVYNVRFVPIAQPGIPVGAVSDANVDQFLAVTRKMHPVVEIDADVRATYTASYKVTSDNADNSWTNLLREIDAKRVAEGTDRNYYGVLKVSYSSGIAGLGYVGGPSAIGWDYLATGHASEVMAHETGHNWNLLHAPCGSPAGPDPSYPYAGGVTGVYGFDVSLGANNASALKAPTMNDIMGYCNGKWISDYDYNKVLAFRAGAAATGSTTGGVFGTAALATTATTGASEPCILIWGHVVDGEPVLEPAFALTTRAVRPRGTGPLTLRATSATGATLWSHSFAATPIADTPNGDRAFSFAIPVGELHAESVAALRLEAGGRVATAQVESAAAAASADSGAVRASRGSAGWVRLRWDAARHPVIMVRDARTGAVLSFARGGDASVQSAAGGADESVDVALPNRVHGAWQRVRVGAAR